MATYKYQIKEGFEKRVFANARNLGNGTVESNQPLDSAYLTLITDQPAAPAQATAPAPAAAGTPAETPAAPAAPQQTSVASAPQAPGGVN